MKYYLLLPLFLLMNVVPTEILISQNARVDWYSLGAGSGTSKSGNVELISIAGQAFVGSSVNGNTFVRSRFFLDSLLYRVLDVGDDNIGSLPFQFTLNQNFPNPFNPATKIRFTLPQQGLTTLVVYNMLGQEVARLLELSEREPGEHEIEFNAVNLTSGLYYYRIVIENNNTTGNKDSFVDVKKMMLVK